MAYSLKPPSVIVTDTDEPEKPRELICTSLASRLAVLHYRQLSIIYLYIIQGCERKIIAKLSANFLKGKSITLSILSFLSVTIGENGQGFP